MVQIPVITTSKRRLRDSLSLEERAKAILARPNALTPMGFINPKVVNKQEAGIISDYRTSQAPVQQRRDTGLSTTAALGNIGRAVPSLAAEIVPGKTGQQFEELRKQYGPLEAFRKWGEEGRTPVPSVKVPGALKAKEALGNLAQVPGPLSGMAGIVSGLIPEQVGLKGGLEVFAQPDIVAPLLSSAVRGGAGALTKGFGKEAIKQIGKTPIPAHMRTQRYFMPPEGTAGGGMGRSKTEQLKQNMEKMNDFVEGRSRFDDPVLNKELDDASKKILDEAERLRATTPPEPIVTTGPTGKPITQAQGPAVPISPWRARVGDVLNHPHLGEVVIENADDPVLLVVRGTSPDATAGTMITKIGRHTFDAMGVEKTADDLIRDSKDSIARSELVKLMTSLIKEASAVSPRAAAAIRQEMGKKFEKVVKELAGPAGGPEAREGAFGAMKGEIARPDFTPPKGAMTDEQFELAQDIIRDRYKYNGPIWLQTQSAFEKLFTSGQALTSRETNVLDEVFGRDLANAAKNKSTDKWQKTGRLLMELWNVPKSIMSSFDLSALLRQGGALLPEAKISKSAAFDMLKSFRSEKHYRNIINGIIDHPQYETAVNAGLDLTLPRRGAGKEEFLTLVGKEESLIGANLAERIPILGRGVRWSNRAYTAFLNKLRFDVFRKWAKMADDEAIAAGREGVSEEALKGLARSINILSGRGELGQFTTAAMVLNIPFFSPRFAASRFQLPIAYYGAGSPVVRKAVRNSIMSYTAFVATMLSLAELSGVGTVEKDPRSSDFGKLRIGKTRIDLWAGFQQPLVFLTQFSHGARKRLATGEVQEIGRSDRIWDFMESKRNPMVVTGLSVAEERRPFGDKMRKRTDPLWAWQVARDLFEPMTFGDTYEAVEEHGKVFGGMLGTLATFGAGITTFGMPDWEDDFKEYIAIPDRLNQERGQISRTTYRTRNPEVDAKLFLVGAVTSLKSDRAVAKALELVRDNNINIDDITGVQDRFKQREESKTILTPSRVDAFIRQAETQAETAPTSTAPVPGGTNRPITPPISELLR